MQTATMPRRARDSDRAAGPGTTCDSGAGPGQTGWATGRRRTQTRMKVSDSELRVASPADSDMIKFNLSSGPGRAARRLSRSESWSP